MNDYIGKYVKRFESGKLGSLALESCGNDWGLSCGSYQLTLRWGNCIKFLQKYFPNETKNLYFNKDKKDFDSKTWPGAEYCSSPKEVEASWRYCYNKVGEAKFFEYEHAYIKSIYYDKIKEKIKNHIDLDNSSRAFQECFWSWAVHSGVNGAYNKFIEATSKLDITKVSHEIIFDAIYNRRFQQTGTNRYKKDWADGERETLRPLLTQVGYGVKVITSPSALNKIGGNGIMKYSKINPPMQCIMSQSACYKGTTTMKPLGVLWHSTGANNTNLKRYVQPDDNATNKNELLSLLGTNTYKNDLNHQSREMGVNAWIGKLANGEVTTVQALPWDYRPWGCGKGKKGSCNSGWIQFEICEDSLTNSEYFEAVYKEACELTAYLCVAYNINPHGKQTLNGVEVPAILCHADSYKLGLGNNHGDVLHWFSKYGKTMDDVRNDVAKLMGEAQKKEEPIAKYDDEVIGIATSTTLVNVRKGPSLAKFVVALVKKGDELQVVGEEGEWYKILWNRNNLKYVYVSKRYFSYEALAKSYQATITASVLNVRSGPGTAHKILTTLKKGQTVIIIKEENGWGQLDSEGWVSLTYVKKI